MDILIWLVIGVVVLAVVGYILYFANFVFIAFFVFADYVGILGIALLIAIFSSITNRTNSNIIFVAGIVAQYFWHKYRVGQRKIEDLNSKSPRFIDSAMLLLIMGAFLYFGLIFDFEDFIFNKRLKFLNSIIVNVSITQAGIYFVK